MKKRISSAIGKTLMQGFILYSCLEEPLNGYQLIKKGKETGLVNWSSGSFYPLISSLLKEKLLTKKIITSPRKATVYSTTKKGKEYLAKISSYFDNPTIKDYFNYLLRGD